MNEAEAAKRTEKAKGKRKASALANDAHESDDALSCPARVPPPAGRWRRLCPTTRRFNSFVSDFVKGGAAAEREFLDTFFDDIPSGFQEEDFGVVPVM